MMGDVHGNLFACGYDSLQAGLPSLALTLESKVCSLITVATVG